MPRDIEITPAVLKTKQAWDYCGGRLIFEALEKEYGAESKSKEKRVMIPFRRTPRGDSYWLRTIIDKALLLAQMEGVFLLTDPGDED